MSESENRMKLKVAIQMDHVSTIDIDGDSTFVLGLEAERRGYEVWHYTPPDLTLRDRKEPLPPYWFNAHPTGWLATLPIMAAILIGAYGMFQILDALTHLLSGLVGEGDGEDLERAHAVIPDEVRDAVREHPGLARPRPRDDQQRPLGVDDRVELIGVELGGRHGRSMRADGDRRAGGRRSAERALYREPGAFFLDSRAAPAL